MPELPDVEVFRRYCNRTALHQPVKSIKIDTAKVLEDATISDLSAKLQGRSFTDTRRHGKHMFVALSDDGWLMLHFGMTGFFRYYKNDESAPEHPRVTIIFENGYALAWDSQRMLGRVALVESPGSFAEENDLGPDALEVSEDAFVELLQSKRGMVKTALMDQSTIAGLGNVYSDEILFQMRMHPETQVDKLSEDLLRSMHGTMHRVLEKVIECGADPGELPHSYLTAHRHKDGKCPGECSGELEKISISGRNGWYCPSCQKSG